MKTESLTKGPVRKSILMFALPILGTSLIQLCYSMVDLMVAGRILGAQAAAAIGSGDLITALLTGFFVGFSVGATVTAAHLSGNGRTEKLNPLITAVFTSGLAGASVICICAIGMAPLFLKWLAVPQEIFSSALSYLQIYLISMIPVVLFNLSSGVLRAVGDSRSPFRAQLFGGICNVILDLVFTVVIHLDVAGLAAASTISQTVCAAFAVYRLKTLSGGSFRELLGPVRHAGLGKVFRIGVPAGLQSVGITLSNLVIQNQINLLGTDVIAAFTIYFKIEMFIYLPILALGQAVLSFTGQNIGAGESGRVRSGFRFSLAAGCLFTVISAVLMLLSARNICSVFISSLTVIDICRTVMGYTLPFYFLYVLLECMSARMRAEGNSTVPMVTVLVAFCGIRVLTILVLKTMVPGVEAAALAYPVSWSAADLILYSCYYLTGKKSKSMS
ncbi:MAG: MATE family efflux transporter [Eubacteriaceae bacterium]